MSYDDFKGKLGTFNEYIAADNQSLNVAGNYGDSTVVRVEIGGNMKQMICDLLAGKTPMMPQIQICLDMYLEVLIGMSPNNYLTAKMQEARAALQAFNQHTGLESTLGRLNAIIGEAAAIASMINFCAAPINPKPIPNLIETIMGSFLGAGDAILNKLGRVIPDRASLCFTTGPPPGINTDAFIDGGLLDDIEKAFKSGIDISGLIEDWIAQFNDIINDFKRIIAFENDIANRATEQGGLGKGRPGAVDALITYPNANPTVVLFQPANGSKATPLVTTRANRHDTSLNETRYTLDVAIKFSEQMDPATITARTSGMSAPSQGTYGTIRVSQGGTELTWATDPQRTDSDNSRFMGTVLLDGSTYASVTIGITVGSDAQSSPTIPTSAPSEGTGKQMLGSQTVNFTCNPALAATSSTGSSIGMILPGQTPEDVKMSEANAPDLPTVMSNASNIFAVWKQLAGYPVQKQDGTVLENVFEAIFDADARALLVAGENYIAPVYTQVAEYDYCGNVTGYKYEFTQGALDSPDLVATAKLTDTLAVRPIVSGVYPTSGMTGVYIDQKITITFSQDMDESSFTLGDTRTTWDPNNTYALGDKTEYEGAEYTSANEINKNHIPSLSPTWWTKTSDAQIGAGKGSVRFKNVTDNNAYVDGGSLVYTNKTLTYTPPANLTAGKTYAIEVQGADTSALGGGSVKVSPVENSSGLTLANTFTSQFTINAQGNSSATNVTVTAQGSTVSLPRYEVAQLLLLSVTASDIGAMAWCTNDTGGATTVVYNGTNWVRMDNGNVIQAA
tara:strand:+ start:560 stop:2926 length:2367 start_codon:yes stop_codon:yes gene_type:complete